MRQKHFTDAKTHPHTSMDKTRLMNSHKSPSGGTVRWSHDHNNQSQNKNLSTVMSPECDQPMNRCNSDSPKSKKTIDRRSRGDLNQSRSALWLGNCFLQSQYCTKNYKKIMEMFLSSRCRQLCWWNCDFLARKWCFLVWSDVCKWGCCVCRHDTNGGIPQKIDLNFF